MAPRFRIPPAPPGLPRRLRAWYVIVAAILTALIAALPSCPRHDAAGRPLWRVETVHDADTVTCRDDSGHAVKIRLQGIDAPEFDQPHGREARNALDAKIAGRHVRVAGSARDQHGRLLGTLWLEDRDINRELVAEGHAWVFGGFVPDPDLVAAEETARWARRGLWAAEHPISPSQWRQEHPPHR
ncbi:MAG: thermonuclease family protein [Planctomycetia bacterium]